MQTTMGEIQVMHDRLDVLLAEQSLREADVAIVAAAPPEVRQPWYQRLTRLVRGDGPSTSSGRPESVASIRARKEAERAREREAGA